MSLALFDIDGTLTRTSGVYDDHFSLAVAEALGVPDVGRDWSLYPNATDSGITHHLFVQHEGRAPTKAELAGVQERYMARLDADGRKPVPIDGASAALSALTARGWSVAIATGNWKAAADWKLAGAGIDVGPYPMATASDAHRRADILDIAIERAGKIFDRIVYFGDAEWDRDAAREARLAFIHIGHDLSDYSNLPRLFLALDTAEVPG